MPCRAAVGLAWVYGNTTLRHAGSHCGLSAGVIELQETAPLAHGPVSAFEVAESPQGARSRLQGAQGEDAKLSQWHGRVVLLNLWATWCAPCRKEMPALDALQQRLGNPDFEVVAVNIDTRDADKPKAFLKELGVEKLAYYADSTAKTFQDLKAIGRAFGMPTTLLVDRQGCELGTIAGPAEWASDDAVELIQAALAQ